MRAAIVHTASNHRATKNGCPIATYTSVNRAKAAMKRSKFRNGEQRFPEDTYQVMTLEEWQEADIEVETYSIMDPERKPIMIRKSERGGCCDPATERYWCM